MKLKEERSNFIIIILMCISRHDCSRWLYCCRCLLFNRNQLVVDAFLILTYSLTAIYYYYYQTLLRTVAVRMHLGTLLNAKHLRNESRFGCFWRGFYPFEPQVDLWNFKFWKGIKIGNNGKNQVFEWNNSIDLMFDDKRTTDEKAKQYAKK